MVSVFLLLHPTESVTEINPEFREIFLLLKSGMASLQPGEESWTLVLFVRLLPFCSSLKLGGFVWLQKKKSLCSCLKTVLLLQDTYGPWL